MREHGGTGPRRGAGLGAAALLALAVVGAVATRKEGRARGAIPVRRDQRPAADLARADAASRTNGPSQANGASQANGTSQGNAPQPVDHPPGIAGLGRAIFDRISRDNITLVAAGIAFYIMLSIFPALGALVSLYGLVGNPADVGARASEYGGLLPPEAMKLITDGLNSFAEKSSSQLSLALATSLVLALWSARAGISSVMTGLNIAYEEIETRSFLVQTLVALALTLAGIVFAAVVILALAVVPIVLKFLYLDQALTTLLDLARWPILAVLVAFGFAVIYRWAPSRSHPRWRWITWGSAVSTVLWLGGSFVFSFYVSRFGSYDATYGSLGAVVVLLLWLWVSALIMLLGAEIDSELDLRATLTGSPLDAVAASVGPPTTGAVRSANATT